MSTMVSGIYFLQQRDPGHGVLIIGILSEVKEPAIITRTTKNTHGVLTQPMVPEFPQHWDVQYLSQFSKKLFFITHDIRT